MDIFGLMPQDTALSAWGLQLAQRCINLLFKETKLGIAVLLGGGIYALINSLRKGSLRQFSLYILSVLIFTCLCIFPHYIPRDIKSYINSVETKSSAITQDILITSPQTPMLLMGVSLNSLMNYVIVALIETTEVFVSDQMNFLKHPFVFQELALINQIKIEQGSGNYALHRQLNNFIQDYFWPMTHRLPLNLTWTDELLIKHYPTKGQEEWGSIRLKLEETLNKDVTVKTMLDVLNQLCPNPKRSYLNQVIDRVMDYQIIKPIQSPVYGLASLLYREWPSMIGFVHILVWVLCIPILLAALLLQRLSLFMHWFKGFLWAKSLWVCAWLAYGASLICIKSQLILNPHLNLINTLPTYAVLTLMALLCLSGLSAVLIGRMK